MTSARVHRARRDFTGVILESAQKSEIGHGEMIQVFHDTVEYWKAWLHKSTYRGRWREMVDRSAMTLKLMTYAPTGALVAAPTAGLPEQVGGERNWDYRFTWVRDASFSVYALLGLGYTEEAAAFGMWLRNAIGAGRRRRRVTPLRSCTGSTAAPT